MEDAGYQATVAGSRDSDLDLKLLAARLTELAEGGDAMDYRAELERQTAEIALPLGELGRRMRALAFRLYADRDYERVSFSVEERDEQEFMGLLDAFLKSSVLEPAGYDTDSLPDYAHGTGYDVSVSTDDEGRSAKLFEMLSGEILDQGMGVERL